MKVEIATSGGRFITIEANETNAPGVLIHESFPGDGTWTLTHRWTGFCFYNRLPSERHGKAIAVVLGAIANWDVRTFPGIMGVYRELPQYWRAWIKELQREFCATTASDDSEGVARALRHLRSRHD